MALNITYWSGSSNPNVPGIPVGSEDIAVGAESAQSAPIPANAVYMSLLAGEATRFAMGENPEATATSAAIAANERVWVDAIPGRLIAALAG